jgi:short subunit fatty acids transporter
MRSTHDTTGVKLNRKKSNPWLPFFGLLLIIAFGAIAFIVGPVLDNQFGAQLGLPAGDASIWLFRGIVFLVLLMVFGLLYAIMAPKPRAMDSVNERVLDKERKEKRQELEARKRHQQAINRKMAKEQRNKK